MAKKRQGVEPIGGPAKKTKLDCLVVEAQVRAAVGRRFKCVPVSRKLELECDGPKHEFDIFCSDIVIGGVSTSTHRTSQGRSNTGATDRATSEIFWLSLWKGIEQRVYVATDAALVGWLCTRYAGANLPVCIALLHYDQKKKVLTPVGHLGSAAKTFGAPIDESCGIEAARILRAAARCKDELVRSNDTIEIQRAASLLKIERSSAGYARSADALNLLSLLFADTARWISESSPRGIQKAARRQEEELVRRSVTRKDFMDAKKFKAARRLSTSGLNAAVRSGRIFFVESDGCRYYPSFLVDHHIDKKCIEAAIKTLSMCKGTEKWLYLTTSNPSLGGLSPVEAIRNGSFDKVQEVINSHLQQLKGK